MKKITVNGVNYLGNVVEKDGAVIVTDSMQVSNVGRSAISSYLKKKHLEELQTIEFSGAGTSVSKTKLTDEENLILDVCERIWKFSEKKAKGGIVANIFDETLGKF